MGNEAQQKELAERSLANGNRMVELATTSARVSQQYEAHMTLFSVAASTGDEDTMAKERQTLHDLLDHLLDISSQIGHGMREAEDIKKQFISLL